MFISMFAYVRIWRDLYRLLKSEVSPFTLREKLRHASHGSLKPTDALILARLLRRHRPGRILEIGSFLGLSTRWLLDSSQGWRAHVTALDPNVRHRIFDEPRRIVEALNRRHYPDRLEIVSGFFGAYGDWVYECYSQTEPCRDRDYVDRLLADRVVIDDCWGKSFDFVYIDGDHTYEAVMRDFRLALNFIAPGGCIAFHDSLSWDGVSRALDEIAQEFHNRATVTIFGKNDRRLLHLIGRANDGIGLFQLAC
jgi:predicted O-methyltransferase YrrM